MCVFVYALMTYLRPFKNQDGVTVVQAWSWVAFVDVVSDTFLHHRELEFSALYQTQGHQQPFSK